MNGSILSEKGEFIALSPHPEVFNIKSRIKIGEIEAEHERFVIPTGTHTVVLSTLYFEDREANAALFQAFAKSLAFTPTQKFNPLNFIYAMFGGAIYFLFAIINIVLNRRVASPATLSLLGVILLFCLRIVLIGNAAHGTSGTSMGYKIGYEIGLAMFPFIILVLLIVWEKKSKRQEEVKKRELELALKAESNESV